MSESSRIYFDPTTATWGVLKHDADGRVTSWEPERVTNNGTVGCLGCGLAAQADSWDPAQRGVWCRLHGGQNRG